MKKLLTLLFSTLLSFQVMAQAYPVIPSGGGIPAWTPATSFQIDDLVRESEKFYKALDTHVSGATFPPDLAFPHWVEMSDDLNRETVVTDDALVVWDGTGGDDVKNSVAILTGAGAMTGLTALTVDNIQLGITGTNVIDIVGGGNLTLGDAANTVIIAGNFQVDGTTTTVNSTTLDVDAVKINLNVDGNQATAEDSSGIEVTMTDATNAQIFYDSGSATFFSLGEAASLDNVVGLTVAQTLLNKLLGNSGAVDANLVLDMVTTTKSTRPCPNQTTVQRDALTGVLGACIYNTDQTKLNVFNGSAWISAGGGLDPWQPSFPYIINDVVHESERIYRKLATGSSDPTFNLALWQELSATSLQISYDFGDTILLDTTGVFIRDNATPIATSLFNVTDSGDTTDFIDILAAGTTIGPLLNVDNLRLDANTLSSTDTNGNVILSPDGAGIARFLRPLEFLQVSTPATPASGNNRFYSKSTDHVYNLKDTGIEQRMSEGDHSLDTFFKEPFIDTLAADFTTGNNATFLGAGAATATPVDETAAPIAGTTSIKYTQVASSLNDFGALPAITLDPKQKGKRVGFTGYVTYDGADDDIDLVLFGVTGNAVIDSVKIKKTTVATRVFFSAFISSSETAVRIGYHVKVEDIGKIFVMDDFELTTNPFVFTNLIETQEIKFTDFSAYGSTDDKIPFMTNQTDSGASVLSISNTAANGVVLTANRDCTVTMDIQFGATASAMDGGWSLDSAQLTTAITGITLADNLGNTTSPSATFKGSQSASINMTVGQKIRPHMDGTAPGTVGDRWVITVTATAISEFVLTPSKSNFTNWREYTPTFTGFGTVTNIKVYHKQVGDILKVKGTFTPGTSTGVTAKMSFPVLNPVITIDFTKAVTGQIHHGGTYVRSVNSTNHGGVMLIDDVTSNNEMLFSDNAVLGAGSIDALTLAIGTSVAISGQDVSFEYEVPITQFSSDVNFLSANLVPLTAYVKDVKAANTDGQGITSGSFVTRELQTVEGDIEIVAVASDQFILGDGTYEIGSWVPGFRVDEHKCKLRNITAGSDAILGTSVFSDTTGSGSNCIIKGQITITAATTFEIQHRVAVTNATDGGGTASNFGVSEVYTVVKITKIK